MPLSFARSILAGGAAEPTFELVSDYSNVNEGDTVIFTLSTTNLDQGTQIPYDISGIDSSDLSSGSVTGNFTIGADGTSTQSFTLAEDALTEGQETLAMNVWSGTAVASVNVTDTSLTPTYNISRSASQINEGQSVTFTLITTNVANSVNVPYSITGVASSDIGGASLSGNFTVYNNTATVTFTSTADSTTEGVETINISAGGASSNCQINDTSRAISYNISSWSDTTPNEGDTVTASFQIYNSSETVYWSINGDPSSDFSATSGSSSYSSITNSGNNTLYNHTVTFTVTADQLTEGQETHIFYLRSGSTSGTIRATKVFYVQDTSLNVPYINNTVTNTGYTTYPSGDTSRGLASGKENTTSGSGANLLVPASTLATTCYRYSTNSSGYINGVGSFNMSPTYLTTSVHVDNAKNKSYNVHNREVRSYANTTLSGTATLMTSTLSNSGNKFTGDWNNSVFSWAINYSSNSNQNDNKIRFQRYNADTGQYVSFVTPPVSYNTATGRTLSLTNNYGWCSAYDYDKDLWLCYPRNEGGYSWGLWVEIYDGSGNYLGRKYHGVSNAVGIIYHAYKVWIIQRQGNVYYLEA